MNTIHKRKHSLIYNNKNIQTKSMKGLTIKSRKILITLSPIIEFKK